MLRITLHEHGSHLMKRGIIVLSGRLSKDLAEALGRGRSATGSLHTWKSTDWSGKQLLVLHGASCTNRFWKMVAFDKLMHSSWQPPLARNLHEKSSGAILVETMACYSQHAQPWCLFAHRKGIEVVRQLDASSWSCCIPSHASDSWERASHILH